MEKFDYLKDLVPVSWIPGHMGAFFLRLMVDKHLDYNNEMAVRNFAHDGTFEWSVEDRIGNIFGQNRKYRREKYKKIYQILSNYHSDLIEIDLAFAHVTFQYAIDKWNSKFMSQKTNSVYGKTDNIFGEMDDTKLHELVLELYHRNNNTFKDCDFPFVKFHDSELHEFAPSSISNLFPERTFFQPFFYRKIVNCFFPVDKFWLGEVLVFYKHCYFQNTIKNTTLPVFNKLDFFNTKDAIRRLKNSFQWSEKEIEFEFNNKAQRIFKPLIANKLATVIDVDMHDLIINKNLDQLIKVDPYFATADNSSIISLLDKAESHIKYICNVFGIDHTTATKKMSDVLQQSDILQKIINSDQFTLY